MRDQHAIPRKLRAYVALPLIWKGETEEYPANLTNLSLSGCFLNTSGQADSGEIVALTISLPEGQEMRLRGTVTRRQEQPQGFGIHFLELEETQRTALALLIADSNEQPRNL